MSSRQGDRYSRGFDEQTLSLLELQLQTLYFHLELDVLPDKIRKEKKQCEAQDIRMPIVGNLLSARTGSVMLIIDRY